MELSHLKAFYHVAAAGSFSAAAEELFISQPALSRQVAALEKELGLQLFSRRGRGVALTDAGRRLFLIAEKMMNLFSEAHKEMRDLKNLETGELSLGASTTIANYILPAILAAYQKRNPAVTVNLNVGNSTQIVQSVVEHKLDLGLIAGSIEVPGLFLVQFAEDELALVAPPDHPLAKTKSINPELLNRETYLCREPGSSTQASLYTLFENLGVKPRKTMVLGDTEAIKRGVISGMGVALLSKCTFEHELKLNLLTPVNLPELTVKRPFFCAYLKEVRLPPAALSFLSLLKKEAFAGSGSQSITRLTS